jgi:hypothetical protein
MKFQKIVLSLIVILSCSLSSTAQLKRYHQQEAGGGISLGYGKPNEFSDNTMVLGLQGIYQYNLAKWFSIRGSLGYAYTLPSKRALNDENGQSVGEINNTSNMLYLGVSPLIYARFRKANVFIGATASVGHAWLVTKYDTPEPLENEVIKKPALGIWPVLGCSFKMSQTPKTATELEFLLTQMRMNNDDSFYVSNPIPVIAYRTVALQISYKFLF